MNPYNDPDSSNKDFKSSSQSTTPDSPLFNDFNYETYKRDQQFLIVDHIANQRNDSEILKIWHHDGERRRVNNDIMN